VIAYAKFATFYDQIMGDRTVDVQRIREYIRRYLPSADSLLELGCGTGAVLAEFAPDLMITGVDRSPDMLAVAAGRVPRARLVESDITAFDLGAQFDVVICIFDTLNHLPSFEAWLALFDRVHEHLAPGGIFAFDVNTVGRLRRLWQEPAFAQDFGGHTVIMDVAPGGGDLSLWQVRIFERLADDHFRLHREVISELGVPLDQIRQALSPGFDLLEETDLDGGQVSDDSNRVFFAYRRHADVPG
jgi:SAM-dependent methyltransferase